MCGEVRASDDGKHVSLAGWVHKRRDHGGVLFLDLRDREGIVQVVVHPEKQPQAFKVAGETRPEYLLEIEGTVTLRPQANRNSAIPTGEVEVTASAVRIISTSKTPPFVLDDDTTAAEDVRFKYRYLDIRRPSVFQTMKLRHRVVKAIRKFLDEEGFIEVETPTLTKATPEGARDFLVPSRLRPGSFWALPQSPQLFKQLLMIGGVDRYYQIARCYRDEDARADRLLEFTQLDLEMSFATVDGILDLTERLLVAVFREAAGIEIASPFPRIAFEDAMAKYGTDKPDLRYDLPITDVTDILKGGSVKVFEAALAAGGQAKALLVVDGAKLSRKQLDELIVEAKNMRAAGLAWLVFTDVGATSGIAKGLSDDEVGKLRSQLGGATGDLALIVCDTKALSAPAMGAVRTAVAKMLGLVPASSPTGPFKFVWITDPPLVEWSDGEKRWDSAHHPFTAPNPDQWAMVDSDPGAIKSLGYDIVLNGVEIGGGSIRIHDPAMQKRVFDLIGLSDVTARERFGWFLEAFDYGAPPHGGIAPGIDRIVWLLSGASSIREASAFPKSGAYMDPMTGAPDAVGEKQLGEVFIRSTAAEQD